MGKNHGVVVKKMNNKFSDSKAVDNLVRYILLDKDGENKRQYAGGRGVDYLNWKNAAKQFKCVQRYFGKESGRRIYHMVVSFPEEYDDLYEVYMLGERMVNQLFGGYQCVFALHENTDNLHIHFAWNAVSYRNIY